MTLEHPSPAQVALDQARRINLQVTPSPFKETAGLVMGGIAATLATIAANHSRKTKKLLYAKTSNLPI